MCADHLRSLLMQTPRTLAEDTNSNSTPSRGIEWSLRAFASMRAVRLFLRARAVINFLMWAASTLEITNGEQRALRKFSASWNLSLLRAGTLKTGPCYLGLNSDRSVSINVSKTSKHFSRNIHGARMFPQCSQFPVREDYVSSVSFCFQDANYAYATRQGILSKIRACEHEQAGTHLIFASNSSKGQILRALSNLMGQFDTPIDWLICFLILLEAIFMKTIIPLVLVRYEVISANSLAIYDLESNVPSWNNC